MEKLIYSGSPQVWVTRDEFHRPEHMRGIDGIVIVLHVAAGIDQHTLYNASLFCLRKNDSDVEPPIEIKVAFLRDAKSRDVGFSSMVMRSDQPNWITVEEFQREVCPMVIFLGNRESYSRVFYRHSPAVGKRLLLRANDLAMLNEFRHTSRLLGEVRASKENLWEQFFSSDEARFTLISVARLLEQNAVSSRSLANVTALDAVVSIWKDKFYLPLRLRFPEVLGERQLANVIIGPNGSGKTNLLLGLATSVLKGHSDITEDKAHSSSTYPETIALAVFTYEPSLWGRLKPGNVKVCHLGIQEKNWRQVTQIIYELGMRGSSGRVEIRLLDEILSRFIDTRKMHFSVNASHDPHRDDIREVSLADLADNRSLIFEEIISRLDRRESPYMLSEEGLHYSLSSGERSLILFCSRLLLVAQHGALILIDEPENHLHPKFINLMVQALNRTLAATQSRALLVTHSPFVVREFERSTVQVLKSVDNGIPELFRPTMQTLGGDVSMIADHVFEDSEVAKGFELHIDRALSMQLQQSGASDEERRMEYIASALGEDGLSYLFAQFSKNRRGAN